ncbi:FtsX-like permease family protein [Ruminococcus sp. 210702-SL.1.03]|uniref:FtsX-like permease family protein n=1 Tax=Ruminococcus sp. 210702-SL.1.03 TaxID=2883233 RepID=UPI001D067190|nr:FtsX-like permease family protein [Ruminococcus sp. 210702-SL.1.03]MCB6615660.1 ABC transporter permease [Ruminococcus sp. 210702-SL.1.03]
MTALFKDALREIRRSFGRFMSVFLIIALGCGFFTGIKASCPDMILTASNYFEQSRLMDLRLRSNIGVKSKDIAAVRSAEGVEGACAGYSKEFYYNYDQRNVVLKAISINSNVESGGVNDLNVPVLQEGRLPTAKNECAVEVKIGAPDTFKIGEKITLKAPNSSEKVTDTLACDTFEIVGVVISPLYIGFERDHASIGSGSVNSNIFLPEESFVCDYYTDLYVRLEGMSGYEPFSEEYKKQTEKRGAAAEKAFEESVSQRYESMKNSAQQKIDYAQGEIETLESVLSTDVDSLSALHEKALAAAAELQKKYAQQEKSFQKVLIKSQLMQTNEKADMLAALIGDTDGSVREGYSEQLEQAKIELAAAKEQLENASELKFYNQTRFDLSDYEGYRDDAEKINNVSKVFPMFFILIAALVCLTTMTRMVEEQRTVIGVYKALGYGEIHILAKYMIYGALASLTGSCIGAAAGLQIFPRLIIRTYRIMYNIPGAATPFRPAYMLAAACVSVLLTCAAAVYSCRRELRAQPAEIMRPKAPAAGRRVLLERAPAIWNKLSFLMKVTVRNLLRYKKRFFMTVIGVAGCTALIITGFGLKNSVSAIIDKQFGEIFRYSAIVALNTDFDNAYKAVEDCNGVKYSKAAFSMAVEADGGDGYSATIIAADGLKDRYVQMKRPDGSDIDPENGVAITQKLADMCDLSEGDSISFTDPDGDRYEAEIGGIMQNYALNYIFMTDAQYEKTFGKKPQDNIALLNTDNSASNESVKSELISDERVLGVTFKDDSVKSFMRSIKSMNAIVLLLIVCAAFLAATVLYNLANINITERMRELATVKVLGFYDGETAAYIYRESVISTAIGIIIGLGLGKLLHYFVVVTVEVEAVMFIRELNAASYIIGALLTAGFACIVNGALYFRLRNIDMAQSLKSIE